MRGVLGLTMTDTEPSQLIISECETEWGRDRHKPLKIVSVSPDLAAS